MKQHIRALRAMLVRDAQLCKRGVLPLLVMMLALAAVCGLAGQAMVRSSTSSFQTAQIALVDEDGSLVSSMAVGLISSQPFSSPLNMKRTTAQKAMEGLADGTFSAAVFLPKDYTDSILTGQNASARLVLSEGAALHGNLIRQLANFGEELLCAGQFGVFSGEEIALERYPQDCETYLKQVNSLYLNEAMSAQTRYFTEETTDYTDTSMNIEHWYILVYWMLFSHLCALLFLPMSRELSTSMLRRLKTAGVDHGAFLSGKLLYPFLLQLMMAAVLWLLWANETTMSPLGFAGLFCALAVAIVFGAALTLCLPAQGAASAVAAAATVGLFSVGGILPRADLSAAVTMFGGFTPLGVSVSLASTLFGGRPGIQTCLTAALWIGLCLLALNERLNQLERGCER